jgi:CHASE2 domain-containing sensor protein
VGFNAIHEVRSPRTSLLSNGFGVFFLDNFPDIAHGNSFLERISGTAYWYQRSVTSGFKKPRNNYVVLVLIDDKVPKATRDNLCLQRKYVADVVRRISDVCAAAIALDLTFGLDTCPDTSPDLYQSTVELQRAVADVSRVTPIIVAQRTLDAAYFLENAPQKLATLRTAGFVDTQVIIEPAIKFDSANGNRISIGLFTFNEDRRKVPLNWPAYASPDSVGHEAPTISDTFALAVVKAYRPDPRILAEIKGFQDRDSHPLTSFLTESEIRCFSAADILAGSSAHPSTEQGQCNSTDGDTAPLRQLNHRVVVIGKDDPQDRWDSVIGEVPGVILQANYIESILDSRLLKPVQGWVSISLAIAWFALIELIFQLLKDHPHRAVLLAILATAVVWILLYDVALMQWGYYLVLWPPSVVAILWRYVFVLSESKKRREVTVR